VVTADIQDTDVTRNDYFQITGSPAKVEIPSMKDTTKSSITANATIKNEGNSDTEYRYEWCAVKDQTNECGGDDDVDFASAAKLVKAGETFKPELDLTIDSTGDYWFKLVVYFGTESSGASRSFTVTSESSEGSSDSGTSGGGTPDFDESADLDTQMTQLADKVSQQSQQLSRVLALVEGGDDQSGIRDLLQVNREQLETLQDVQNKTAELNAVSRATRRLVEEGSSEAIVETYMKFNSVEMGFLVTNPLDKKKTLTFESNLPKEVKPEHIKDAAGLSVKFDANSDTYYVTGEVTLGPRETITKVVEIKDIWRIEPEQLEKTKKEATELTASLTDTNYSSQATILKGDITETIRKILRTQKESYTTPQDHILTYRENKNRLQQLEDNMKELK
jgi:hypothetical protein